MRALWKQKAALHPTFTRFNRSFEEDWFLLEFELKLQAAHARTLCAAGILSEAEGDEIATALESIASRYGDGPCPESSAEDIHTWIEAALVESAGEAGKKIHTARSRNDQVATLLKMYVLASAEQIADRFRCLAQAFCEQAKASSDLVFPLQTHAQFAAPGSVGFWGLRFASAFERLAANLTAQIPRWRQYCPLGAGAVAGSSIGIDREMQARLLGFEGPARNALDATSTREECLELLALLAQAALHFQSFATDVIVFSQTPFAWTRYPGSFGTGSSMMPNKTNPDAMELLRGECCAVTAAHGQALTLLKGLPSGYNRDLQCIKPLLRQTVEKVAALGEMVLAFVEALDFDPKRLARSLDEGHIDATLRMEQLVQGGTPLRDAHHAVADALETADAPISADAYRTIGSASPEETRRMADQILADLKA